MSDGRKFIQGQNWYLAGSGVTSSATSITLSSMLFPDNTTTVTTTDIGSLAYMTLEPETSREENISFTGITQNANGTATLTGVTRGLGLKAPYTADAANRYAHAGGSLVRVTNSVPFYNDFANKENNETISQVWTFSSTNRPALASDVDTLVNTEFPTYGQLARTAATGAVPATTVDPGIVYIATDAQIAAGTGTSGSYSLVPNGASFTNTAAATKAVVSKSNAKIDDTWLGLTTAGDTVYSDGTDLQRLAIGTATYYLTSTGTAPAWGGVNLDEANTFFGATAFSATQANTLTAGTTSNADSLHTHASSFSGMTDSFLLDMSTETVGFGCSGYSDATTPIISHGFNTTLPATYYTGLALDTDYGSSYYTKVVPARTAVGNRGLIIIGTDFWTTDNNATAGSRIQKNGSAVTISGTTPSNNVLGLGHDPTLSYLLALSTTTTILRYSGISGTTVTFVDTITLSNAVSITGFLFDNTNSRYICLDLPNNLIRRFNASGTQIDTAAYTVDDTITLGSGVSVVGLAFIRDRVHIATITVTDTGTPAFEKVRYVPTTMTR